MKGIPRMEYKKEGTFRLTQTRIGATVRCAGCGEERDPMGAIGFGQWVLDCITKCGKDVEEKPLNIGTYIDQTAVEEG